jgi:hypothetical protein
MRVMVIRNAAGEVVGTHILRGQSAEGYQVGVVPPEDKTTVEIDVPDDFMELDAAELHRRLTDLVPREGREA